MRHTFLWNVPSSAATITVFPEFAISSQNSTKSGNYIHIYIYVHVIKLESLTNCPSSIPIIPYS